MPARMRAARFPAIFLLLLVIGTFFYALRRNLNSPERFAPSPAKDLEPLDRPQKPSRPQAQPLTNTREHPIELLVKENERGFRSVLDRQSKTLDQAVKEYKRRHGLAPPPLFDEWYKFAKKHGVQLIDEYDTIHDIILPFWGLKAKTIRERAREALGFDDNQLIAIMIRGGKVTHYQAGPEWQQKATIGMMDKFIHLLPDMDLAFNIQDEPRVVVPADELDRLVRLGKERQARSLTAPSKNNTFSHKPQDLTSGQRVLESKTTRFNVYAHQPVWIPSRLSCPVSSPARAVESDTPDAQDDISKYAFTQLGFINNHTALSDICNTPALASSFGFFERPNAYNVVHDLFPIFSQSKLSSFQDIIYPSPWYWDQKVQYNPKKDPDWSKKAPKMWWVGSTTGGFSRRGGWRRQHRQRLVGKLNALDSAQIMMDKSALDGKSHELEGENPDWVIKDVDRKDYEELMDVHFSHVGQCDPGDCDAMKEYFKIVPGADFQQAWKSKFLLDMDGNAFSGRFYAFLKSKSLPIKMSLFREWHEEWLKPWVHFMPLSLRGDEGLEMVRYLAGDAEGKRTAEMVAERGRMWAEQVLRNEDFEVWFFRLLLEYARVIDDNRENIGYDV